MRLTLNKAQNWRDRMDRTVKTIDNIHADIQKHRMVATGGDLSALTDILCVLLEARAQSLVADTMLMKLVEREQRKVDAK